MLKKIRLLSYQLSFFLTIALLITSIPPIYSQDIKKQFEKAGKTFTKLIAPQVKKIAKDTASKINRSLKEKFAQFKGMGPKFLIDELLKNLEKLGTNIADTATCMLKGKGEQCSTQKRAAFIATAIVVLALTATLIGLTITTAATSKEVDTQVAHVSQEVKGWSPSAIFTRLKNTIGQFKQNLLNMKECLIKRSCTKTQKRLLYATAGTIAGLASIAVGVGIGSFIYTQYRAKKAEEAGLPEYEEEDLGKALEEIEPFETKTTWKSRFMDNVNKVIPIDQAQTTLRSVYTQVKTELGTKRQQLKEEIAKGVIKAKDAAKLLREEAKQLFEKAITKITDFNAVIKEALNVNVEKAREQIEKLENLYKQFKDGLKDSFIGQMTQFRTQVQDLIAFIKNTAEDVKALRTAWGNLSKDEILIAKIRSLETQQTKKLQTELKRKTQQEEKDALMQEIQNLIIAKDQAGFLQKRTLNKQLETARRELERKGQEIDTFTEKINILDQQITLAQKAKLETLEKIYEQLVKKINAINPTPIGTMINVITKSIVPAINGIGFLHDTAGKIGIIAQPANIRTGLNLISTGIGRIGEHTDQALKSIRIGPDTYQLITAPPTLGPIKTISTLLKAARHPTFIKDAAQATLSTIQQIPPLINLRKPIVEAVNELKGAIEGLRNLKSTFTTTIKQAPLKSIPKLPIILLKTLAAEIVKLKKALIKLAQASSGFVKPAVKIIPQAFVLVNDLNTFFGELVGAELVNKQFLENLRIMQATVIPELSEGIKSLMDNLKKDQENLPKGTLD